MGMLWGWHCVRPPQREMQAVTIPAAVVSVVLCWWLTLGSAAGNHHDASLLVVSVYVAAHTTRHTREHDTTVAVSCAIFLELVLCLMAGMMKDRRAVVSAWGLVAAGSVCWVEVVGTINTTPGVGSQRTATGTQPQLGLTLGKLGNFAVKC